MYLINTVYQLNYTKYMFFCQAEYMCGNIKRADSRGVGSFFVTDNARTAIYIYQLSNLSVVATTAENKNDCKDDDPSTIIVFEKMA